MEFGFPIGASMFFYAVIFIVLLAMAVVYGIAKWTPKRIAALVSTEKLPAWRRYQTLSCLVLALTVLVMLCAEASLRGGCAVFGGTVFWVRCVGAAVLLLSVAADLLASKHFTGKW